MQRGGNQQPIGIVFESQVAQRKNSPNHALRGDFQPRARIQPAAGFYQVYRV